MVVYFSASTRNVEDNLEIYRKITSTINAMGVVIAHNWVEVAGLRTGLPRDIAWWESMCGDVAHAIDDADCLIVEASSSSTLGVGYELARALGADKPVLALVREGEEGNSYISGIKHSLLTHKSYTPETLEVIVQKFIRKRQK